MAAIANFPGKGLDRPPVGTVQKLQDILAPLGTLPGLAVSLKTPHGSNVPITNPAGTDLFEAAAEAASSPADREPVRFTLDDGNEVWVHDADERNATLVAGFLQASLRAIDAQRREELLLEELGANWESLEALYEISTDALRSGNINEALRRLIDRLAALQDGLHAALFIRRQASFHPLVTTERDAETLTPAQLGVAERAIRDRRVVVVNRLAQAPDAHTCWRDATCLAAAPFSWQGSVGFVVVWREDTNDEFDSPFCRVLEAITFQASVMMEGDRLNRKVRESELLAQEVDIASSIQQELLLANAPKDVPALDIAACGVPSRQIDGDFHDFFQHPDGTVDVLIGDVMGKGVAAALLGAATKSQFLRSVANLALRAEDGAPRPADIVTRAASRLSDRLIALDRFVTLCYARFDATSRKVIFVDCGHTSMIVESKANPECAFLRGADLPLGVFPNYKCEQHSVDFHPGETYFLYSDGVTENRSPEGELFGPERLAECVQNWSSLGPALLVEQIRKEAARFAGSEKFSDDFTCVAVRVKLRPGHEEPLRRRAASFACDGQALGGFRIWLQQCIDLSGSGLGEDDTARLQLACSEVFTNCVVHTGDRPCVKQVAAECRCYQDHVTVQISHRGPAFDPLAVPPPVFDGSKDGGFGIFIVLRSADEAFFARTPDGTNVITMSFLRTRTERSS